MGGHSNVNIYSCKEVGHWRTSYQTGSWYSGSLMKDYIVTSSPNRMGTNGYQFVILSRGVIAQWLSISFFTTSAVCMQNSRTQDHLKASKTVIKGCARMMENRSFRVKIPDLCRLSN